MCAYKICKSCLEFGEPQINCSLNCGSKIEFIDNNSFCKWLLSNEKYTCMAHNLKGYDGCFLLQYFLNVMVTFDQWPTIIMNGTKTLSIEFRNIKIIDSLSFIPCSLDTFPKI